MQDLPAELFSSKVRAAVLGHILPRPHLGFSLTDLSRLLGIAISSLQHECYKLERIGVLYGRRSGNARLYRVSPDCPVGDQLTALVVAGIGPEAALRGAVDGVPGLEGAFLAGPVPTPGAPGPAAPTGPTNGDATGGAGTRLVLIGEVPLEALDDVLARAEVALGVPPGTLELAFFRPPDWLNRIEQGNAYVAALLAAPRLRLLGDAPEPAAAGAGVLPVPDPT